ncbi:N-acetyltransferase [Thalassoroseus pseudoceratinae]|uniref:N-acetyltransferase n=1 Tax=Thalassoroseus pseudoceratinae TaxID=2713176 RepID=UPI001423544B|nr:N-acetyltransferase [Thalassoroseus pseudoceratinae]
MNVHQLSSAPSQQLTHELMRFEEQFAYPLGEGQTFRISHGEDYPRFFRALGKGVCFVAESHGRIAGVLGASIRRLVTPKGDERIVIYFGDLKIDPARRGGKTLLRLADAVRHWVSSQIDGTRVDGAFAIVMEGTAHMPSRYTGRLGIPSFSEVGRIAILRLPASQPPDSPSSRWVTTPEQAHVCCEKLSADAYVCLDGHPEERSEMSPIWLMEPNGRACGRLEDTCHAKRLITSDGTELRSAHLSGFTYQTPRDGVALLRHAVRCASSHHLTGLFVAVPGEDAADFRKALAESDAILTSAKVFGVAFEPDRRWHINTAEI